VKFWRRPLDLDQINVPKGKVVIIADCCKGCGFCVEYCPRDVLELSRDFNKKGYHPPVPINEESCVNCHFCEIICPEFAIFSVTKT
jgi:2-oxoglutarate ferredoxin oxidoreductase subunit delta